MKRRHKILPTVILVVTLLATILVLPASAEERTVTGADLLGEWILKPTLDLTPFYLQSFNLEFESNGQIFDGIREDDGYMTYGLEDIGEGVYGDGIWVNNAYRIIDIIDIDPSEVNGFYSFLLVNAVLPEEPETPTPTPTTVKLRNGEYYGRTNNYILKDNLTTQEYFTEINSFRSNNEIFERFDYVNNNGNVTITYENPSKTVIAYSNGQWNSAYRTITIPQNATASSNDLLILYSIYAENERYYAGYEEGFLEGQKEASGDAYEDGYFDGYEAGYNNGLAEGDGSGGTGGIIPEFFGQVFQALDRCVFFADFTLLDFVKGTLAIFALIWFLKLMAGG